MPLVQRPFASTFAFARASAAQHRNAAGVLVTAGANVPRFDHDPAGGRRGLLMEGRPETGAPDRITVLRGDWETGRGTVLHEYETPAGEVVRRAFYTATPASTVDGCLRAKGRERLIAFVPEYLTNRGGYVVHAGRRFSLGGYLAVSPGVALGVGLTPEALMIEG